MDQARAGATDRDWRRASRRREDEQSVTSGAQIRPTAIEELKNAYSLEFLSLPSDHSEDDLHAALLRNLGRFIAGLGRDFCFVGSEYPVQLGNQDFAIDLVVLDALDEGTRAG